MSVARQERERLNGRSVATWRARICVTVDLGVSRFAPSPRGIFRLANGASVAALRPRICVMLQPRDVSWTRKVSRFLIGLCLVFVESVLLVNGEIGFFCTRVVRKCVLIFVSVVSITGPMDVFDNTGSIKRQGQLPRACAGLTLRNKSLREKLNRRYIQEPKF